jgi:hypothetical protein
VVKSLNDTTRFVIEISVIIAIIFVLLAVPTAYIKGSTEEFILIVDRLIDEIYNEEFQKAEKTFDELSEKWDKEKGLYSVIIEEKFIMDLDDSLTQCKSAVKIRHKPNAYEYANILKNDFRESYSSISFKIWNIF